MPSDPKPLSRRRKPTRHIDRNATLRACLTYRECPCGRPSATGHHVIAKGGPHYGDDVIENIVPVCGSGTTGCHGRIENADPAALWMLGDWIMRERRDVAVYVLRKLGDVAGREWLEKRLRIDAWDGCVYCGGKPASIACRAHTDLLTLDPVFT